MEINTGGVKGAKPMITIIQPLLLSVRRMYDEIDLDKTCDTERIRQIR